MIKTNYTPKAEKSSGGGERIPAGGYVAVIKGAKVEQYSWGDVLIVSFDIAEGEFKDFFAKQYRTNLDENKKWKGTYRLTIPTDKTKPEYLEGAQRAFNNFVFALEDSNSGYHYDGNETAFKGKKIGVLFRNKEFAKDNGETGWYSECCSVTDVAEIKAGTFKMPKDKPLTNKPQTAVPVTPAAADDDDDEDLPF